MATLLKRQRAQLYHLLQENNFNPAEFELGDYIDGEAEPGDDDYIDGEVLSLRGTGYYFGCYANRDPDSDDLFEVEFSPGIDRAWESRWCTDWSDVEDEFTGYLQQLRREMETVDPWSEVQTFFAAIELLPPERPAEPQGVTQIPEPQRQHILRALKNVETTLMKHVRDSEERQAFVRDQFKVLEDASTKFNRKDYLMLAYNAITGLATTLGLSSQFWAGLLKPLMEALGFFGKLLR